MTDEIANELESLSAHLELDGKPKESIAYSNAADTIRQHKLIPADPSQLDGVGETIRGNIVEYMENDEIEKLESLRDRYPYLDELRQVEGIGPKTAKRIHETLGIEQVGELKERSDELPEVHRIGEKTAENIVEAVDDYIDGVTERKDWAEADRVMATVENILWDEFAVEIEPAGSFRRESETVGDLDVLLVRDDDCAGTAEIFAAIEEYAERTLSSGPTKCSVVLDGMQVDFRVVPQESFGAALLYFTGSKSHNIKLRSHAIEQGYKLNEYGLYDEQEQQVAGRTERGIYDELGLDYIEPYNRDGQHIEEP
jgi:DNA polymerase (family 10)